MKDYRERSKFRERQEDRIAVKDEAIADNEQALVDQMKTAAMSTPFRSGLHFFWKQGDAACIIN